MALSNVANTDTYYVAAVVRMNQVISLLNQITEGNSSLSGTITLTNPSLFNGGITLNVANGMIRGDGGLVSNIRGTSIRTGSIPNLALQNNSITLKTDYPNQITFVNPTGPLGNTININITPVTSTDDTTSTNIASAQLTNTIHQLTRTAYGAANVAYDTAVGAFAAANSTSLDYSPAFNQANTAANTAIAAFDRANVAITNVATAQTVSVAAFTQANVAITNVATAQTVSLGAFTQANLASTFANNAANNATSANTTALAAEASVLNANAMAIRANSNALSANAMAIYANNTALGAFAAANTKIGSDSPTLTGTITLSRNANVIVHGSVTAQFANGANKASSGTTTQNFNLRDGPVQYVHVTGAHSWVFTGWPTGANTFADIQVVARNAGAFTISYSNTINWMYGNGQISTTLSDMTYSFEATGNNIFYFWSMNQGVTIYGKAM